MAGDADGTADCPVDELIVYTHCGLNSALYETPPAAVLVLSSSRVSRWFIFWKYELLQVSHRLSTGAASACSAAGSVSAKVPDQTRCGQPLGRIPSELS